MELSNCVLMMATLIVAFHQSACFPQPQRSTDRHNVGSDDGYRDCTEAEIKALEWSQDEVTQYVNTIFLVADKNGDRLLTAEELTVVATRMGQSREEIDGAFEFADTNEDGKLNDQEVAEMRRYGYTCKTNAS